MKELTKHINKVGQAEFAKLVGVNPQVVWNWLHRDNAIPAKYVLIVEEATDIPCWEIRPDLYPPKRFKKAA